MQILLINREDKFFIPKNDSVKKDDKIYVIINSSQMVETLKAFGHEEKISKKILIIGGGNIGQQQKMKALKLENREGEKIKNVPSIWQMN